MELEYLLQFPKTTFKAWSVFSVFLHVLKHWLQATFSLYSKQQTVTQSVTIVVLQSINFSHVHPPPLRWVYLLSI